MLTPYLVKPHPDIINDILAKSKLTRQSASTSPSSTNMLFIENWTKWRLFVNSTAAKEQNKVVYGHTADSVAFREKAKMNLEFRPEYKVEVETTSSSQSSHSAVSVARTAPPYSAAEWGIYNHFEASSPESGNDEGESDNVVRVVPRFLFGLAREAVEEMYGPDVDNYPIIGIFTSSTKYDRFIIQTMDNPVFVDPGDNFSVCSWQNGIVFCDLLFYHAKLLINRLEMEAEKSGPIEKIFEVPQGDISDLLRN